MSVCGSIGGAEVASPSDIQNIQIFIPEFSIQKCLQVHPEETVWDVKLRFLSSLPQKLDESFNYGLFLPPCNGRAGKFLLEDRAVRDYPFQDCVPYLELKYKKRVYKMLNLDEKTLKQLHSKTNLKKFIDAVLVKSVEKVEKMVNQGLDPNFHDSKGETPLTLAAEQTEARLLLMALVAGGAHMDFRNAEGQTALHKAALLPRPDNVRTLLELGSSANYRDPIGLTPLYYCMLREQTCADGAELMLRDFALVGNTDMHGNQELHQACKNGLVAHVEHLLYYGADIDARNVNGNTPLHVCAVNARDGCARVLLFRGADVGVQNNQGQTAYHVAQIVGSSGVADAIRTHNPNEAVPYRDPPTYNNKRRPAGFPNAVGGIPRSISRSRSFSQSSIHSHSSLLNLSSLDASAAGNGGGHYRKPSANRSVGNVPASPSPSANMCSRVDPSQTLPGELRAPMVRAMKKSMSGNDYAATSAPVNVHAIGPPKDANMPRILVIPRGPKGYGFILRGAKKMEEGMIFEPTQQIPALQFFEGVDMNGMAMKAGLRPGDFLIEINQVDVRRASHEQVVSLIQATAETISLQVITVWPPTHTSAIPAMPQGGRFSTMPGNRNNRGERSRLSSMPPPAPPRRHPSTSLSSAKGRAYAQNMFTYDDPVRYANGRQYQQQPPQKPQLSPSKSMEQLSAGVTYRTPVSEGGGVYQQPPQGAIYRDGADKIASVRNRGGSTSRRISAAELEQLMARQLSAEDTFVNDSSPKSSPKKYSSVADMKRQKQQKAGVAFYSSTVGTGPGLPRTSGSDESDMPPAPPAPLKKPNLKSFSSQPNLQSDDEPGPYAAPAATPVLSAARRGSVQSTTSSSDYRRPVIRPKTPPPPPPPPPPGPAQKNGTSAPPPPPPPPPPVEALRCATTDRTSPPTSTGRKSSTSSDCRGVTAEALLAVKLKSSNNRPPIVKQSSSSSNGSGQGSRPKFTLNDAGGSGLQGILKQELDKRRTAVVGGSGEESRNESTEDLTSKTKPQGDFNSDLKAALARRRNQMEHGKLAIDGVERHGSAQECRTFENKSAVGSHTVFSSDTNLPNRSGLSLKESVRQNVPSSNPNTTISVGGGGKPGFVGQRKAAQNHSPPPVINGFAKQKDSGYTSSRTSLEPSECGDESQQHTSTTVIRIDEEADDDGYEGGGVPPPPDYFPPPPPPEVLQANINGRTSVDDKNASRVSLLSQQLEDSFGGMPPPTLPKKPAGLSKQLSAASQQRTNSHLTTSSNGRSSAGEHDSVSVASTLSTLSGLSESTSDRSKTSPSPGKTMLNGLPMLPPPDYDDVGPMDRADSGTGDSEADDVTPTLSQMDLTGGGDAFRSKALPHWSKGDVCDWLKSLQLGVYCQTFSRSGVDGGALVKCDRAMFTKLGVTRIAHRHAIENSIKMILQADSTAF